MKKTPLKPSRKPIPRRTVIVRSSKGLTRHRIDDSGKTDVAGEFQKLLDGLPKGPTLKPRKPIPRRSKKTEAVYVERRKLVSLLIEQHPWCTAVAWVGPKLPPCHGRLTVHEVLPRGRGGSILDPANCMVLCEFHNGWAADHPKEAEALGLSRRRWTRSV